MNAVVITVSDRCSTGQAEDRSGPLAEALLTGEGWSVTRHLVGDEADQISAAIVAASATAHLVLTTGGTGFGPRDVTPEATRAILEREAPGLAEHLRRSSVDALPTAVLSRARAGTVGGALVVNLPGSTGGVRNGIAALLPLLPHVVSQLAGGDH